MNWTTLIGRSRPIESEALRLLVLLQRLGSDVRGEDADGRKSHDDVVVRRLRGEQKVQHLDHLTAHPATLAYLLMDVYLHDGGPAEQRGALARRVRWLLANDRRHFEQSRQGRVRRTDVHAAAQVDGDHIHRLQPWAWRRWDDVLASVHSRGLLRVEAGDPSGETSARESLRYGLTARASRWLDSQVYPRHPDAGFHSQVCTVIDDYLPQDDVPGRLLAAEDRLHAFCRDQSLTAADDAAPALFHAVFRERLS